MLWKVEGLSDHDAHRVGTTSGLTIHGVIDHLTDVERSWVRRWFAGRRGLHIGGVDADHVQPPLDLAGARLKDLVNAYVEESQALRRGHRRARPRRRRGPRRPHACAGSLHHLIEETSRHLGHLDLLRELADGATGEEP